MISLSPSAAIKKSTSLDFDLLADIINMVLSRHHSKSHCSKKIDISIHKLPDTTEILGLAMYQSRHINLYVGEDTTIKGIISTLLHEIRHIIQFEIFKVPPWSVPVSNYAYKKAPTERDARKFEKISASVLSIYNSMQNISTIYSTHQLDKYTEPT